MTSLVELVVAGTVGDADLREAITGDLVEEYARLARSRGRFAARAWLVRQLVVSASRLAALRTDTGSACDGAPSAARFYGALAGLVAGASLLALAADRSGAFAAARSLALPACALSLVAFAGGGSIAAALVRRAPLAAAFALGLIAAGIGVGSVCLAEHRAPLWYAVATPLLVVPAAVAGALYRIDRRRRAGGRDG